MYTKEQLTIAKDILLNLISDDRVLKNIWNGICYNTDKHILNTTDLYFYGFIPEFAEDWEHHSGLNAYPVKDDWDYPKWEGTNLNLRIDLMKYIFGKIDELLEGV